MMDMCRECPIRTKEDFDLMRRVRVRVLFRSSGILFYRTMSTTDDDQMNEGELSDKIAALHVNELV